jgi:hypothetical protein
MMGPLEVSPDAVSLSLSTLSIGQRALGLGDDFVCELVSLAIDELRARFPYLDHSRPRCLCPLCPSDKELCDWVMTLM